MVLANPYVSVYRRTRASLCLYACMPVRLYACMPVCLYACMPVRLYACMPVRLYACMPVRLYACMPVCLYAYMPVCLYACTCVYERLILLIERAWCFVPDSDDKRGLVLMKDDTVEKPGQRFVLYYVDITEMLASRVMEWFVTFRKGKRRQAEHCIPEPSSTPQLLMCVPLKAQSYSMARGLNLLLLKKCSSPSCTAPNKFRGGRLL